MSCGDPPIHTCTNTGSWTEMLSCAACMQTIGRFVPASTTFTSPTTFTLMLARAAWTCPRCQRVNAPHVDQCSCAAPTPATLPSPLLPFPTLPPTEPLGPTWIAPQYPWKMPQIWCAAGGADASLGALDFSIGVHATCDNSCGAV